MKRCYNTLIEENKRMQKELHELRALKATQKQPIYYMQSPAATLAMCPRCKQIFTVSFGSNSVNRSEPEPSTSLGFYRVLPTSKPPLLWSHYLPSSSMSFVSFVNMYYLVRKVIKSMIFLCTDCNYLYWPISCNYHSSKISDATLPHSLTPSNYLQFCSINRFLLQEQEVLMGETNH